MTFESSASATIKKTQVLSYDFTEGSASVRNGGIKETDEQSFPAYMESKIHFSL